MTLPQDSEASPAIRPRPPTVLTLFALAALGLEGIFPLSGALFDGGPWVIPGGVLIILCGVAIAALAVRTLILAETTFKLDRASRRLVNTGIFARTRNPIYLGFVIMLLGFAIMAGSLWMLILTPVFVLYLRFFVIAREEEYLERRFGDEYRTYKQKVPRWF